MQPVFQILRYIYESAFTSITEYVKGGETVEEENLIKALRKGDTNALEELIRYYNSFVSGIISGILKGRSGECEELTQDVFLTVWDNRKKLKAGKLKSYLAVIARNKVFSHLRKNREELPLEDDILIYDNENIELKIEQKELSRLLDEALGQLSEEHEELFVRHYYYGQSVSEAAAAMGINASTAKSWLKRGREKLREILIEKGVEYEKRSGVGDIVKKTSQPTKLYGKE